MWVGLLANRINNILEQQQQQQQQQQILLKIGKWLITLLSHPQIAYKLIEAAGAEDILQNKIYI